MNSWPTLAPFFFFNATATTEIYTLSLHDALPIYRSRSLPIRQLPDLVRRRAGQLQRRQPERPRPLERQARDAGVLYLLRGHRQRPRRCRRSEEHTSELQSLAYLVCRLLLEKKNDE